MKYSHGIVTTADRRGGGAGQAPEGTSGACESDGLMTLRMPARPGTKIDLRHAPSAMEQLAASWGRG